MTLVFNSAKIYPQYAEIEVYVKMDLPQKDFNGQDVTLYFAADNIIFSQEEGVIAGSVGLLEDYTFKLGNSNKAGILLQKMQSTLVSTGSSPTPVDDEYEYSGTYVNFDCDGFKELGVGGRRRSNLTTECRPWSSSFFHLQAKG